jgi:hypothetical protein
MEKEVIAFNPPLEWIREKIELAGNKIGSVHFNKRSNDELRKMSYRLHVVNPSTGKAPGTSSKVIMVKKSLCMLCGEEEGNGKCLLGPFRETLVPKKKVDKKTVDKKNNQMTVYDANKVIRDKENEIIGRGAYRTVPLEKVIRIKNNGITYIIKQY